MKNFVTGFDLLDRKTYLRGFSIMELMIVVVILGILAAIAVPSYRTTLESTYGNKAKVVLKTIHAAQKMYLLDHNEYCGIGSLTGSDLVIEKYLEDPNTPGARFSYTIDSKSDGPPPEFTAKATRPAGPYGGWIKIRQDGKFKTGGGWPFSYEPSY